MRTIAYTYNADTHCEDCTDRYFGGAGCAREAANMEATDSEGNPVRALLSTDEWWEPTEAALQVLACGDCGAHLAEQDTRPTRPAAPDLAADWGWGADNPYRAALAWLTGDYCGDRAPDILADERVTLDPSDVAIYLADLAEERAALAADLADLRESLADVRRGIRSFEEVAA